MISKKFIPLIVIATILPVMAMTVFSEIDYGTYDDKHTTVMSGLRANLSPLELADNADIIVKGKIVNTELLVHEKDKDRGIINVYTMVELEPEIFLKGDVKGNLIIKQPGGETAEYRTIAENLSLKTNDRVLMYLTLADEGGYYNPYSGITTTYLLTEGMAKNHAPLELDVGEKQLTEHTRGLLKQVETRN